MKESYIQKLVADRIGGKDFMKGISKPSKLESLSAGSVSKHNSPLNGEIIDLSSSEPDAMADVFVVETISREASKWENRCRSENGTISFNLSVSKYLNDVFNVSGINAEKEVNHCIGSKSAMAILAQAFINPGDVVLLASCGLNTFGEMSLWLGGEVYTIPLEQKNKFLPDFESVPPKILKRSKVLFISYPNNPTGATATKEFFNNTVKFAKKNDIIVVHDASYAALTFDSEPPLSFLSVSGAKKVGVEVHSLSKSFNMSGWRIGFIAGSETIISAFKRAKLATDSGQFKAIQNAAIYALERNEITRLTAEKYRRRLKLLVEALTKTGFKVEMPKASFYLFVKIPKGIKNLLKFELAEDFAVYLASELNIVVMPFDEYGKYVRFSVTYPAFGEDEEKRVMDDLLSRLMSVKFDF